MRYQKQKTIRHKSAIKYLKDIIILSVEIKKVINNIEIKIIYSLENVETLKCRKKIILNL